MIRDRSKLKGVAFALLSFAAFSTHDAVIKVLGGAYAPFQILFFSVLLGFPLATLMLMSDSSKGTLRPVHPWWLSLRCGAAVLTGISAFYAFSVLPLAEVYTFIFAAPMIITILSIPILGEKVGLHRWAAVLVGLIGVLIVLNPGSTELTLGHLAGLGAALGGALSSVITRKIGAEERSHVLMLYPMMSQFLVMGAILPFVYKPMPAEHLGLLAFMSLLGFGAALCLIGAYRNADAAIIAPMQYSQILWAALFGALFFNEFPDQQTWVGVAVIIAAGVYVVLRESLGGRSKNTPVLRSRSRHETGTAPRSSAIFKSRTGHTMRAQQDLAKRPPEE